MSRQFSFYHLPPEDVKTFATEAAVCGCIAKVTVKSLDTLSREWEGVLKALAGSVNDAVLVTSATIGRLQMTARAIDSKLEQQDKSLFSASHSYCLM